MTFQTHAQEAAEVQRHAAAYATAAMEAREHGLPFLARSLQAAARAEGRKARTALSIALIADYSRRHEQIPHTLARMDQS